MDIKHEQSEAEEKLARFAMNAAYEVFSAINDDDDVSVEDSRHTLKAIEKMQSAVHENKSRNVFYVDTEHVLASAFYAWMMRDSIDISEVHPYCKGAIGILGLLRGYAAYDRIDSFCGHWNGDEPQSDIRKCISALLNLSN